MYSSTLPLTSALEGVDDERHAPSALLPKRHPVPSLLKAGLALRAGFLRVRKISSSLRFDPRTVQPIASRYTLSRPIEIFQQKLKFCKFFPAFFYLALQSVLCKIVKNRTSSCPMETSAALWMLCRKHSRPKSKRRAAPSPHTVY